MNFSYSDNGAISNWAIEYVAYCNQIGFMMGDDNNCFNPSNNTTRAEVVMIFYRFIEILM